MVTKTVLSLPLGLSPCICVEKPFEKRWCKNSTKLFLETLNLNLFDHRSKNFLLWRRTEEEDLPRQQPKINTNPSPTSTMPLALVVNSPTNKPMHSSTTLKFVKIGRAHV